MNLADVRNVSPTWVGYNPASNNVGWQLPLDTTTIQQGASQPLTITAGPLGATNQTTVTIDQPPTITLSSPAPGGSGNATFSFTVKTSTGMSNEQWINGMIAPSLGAIPACSFSFWVNYNAFALINDAGTAWQYGTLNSGLSNSECRINTDSSYLPSGDGKSGTLNLDVTFLSGLQGQQQIWMITADDWLGSNWTYAGTWTPAPLSITTTSLPNGVQGVSYSQTLSATGGTPPYTWSLYEGWPPNGLSLSSSGQLSGTPTSSSTGNFWVSVRDSLGALAISQQLTVTITGPPPPTVTIWAPWPGLTISGTYTMSGSAADSATPINYVQIFDGSTQVGSNIRGGAMNVQLQSTVNTGTLPQGINQTFTVSATDEDSPPQTGQASVYSVTVDQPPTVSFGIDASQRFAFAASSSLGATEIQDMYGWIAPSLGAQGCGFAYYAASNIFYLYNDAGTGLLPGVNIGIAGSNPSNSQCTVNAGASSYSAPSSSSTATLSLSVSFAPTFTGPQQIYLSASDGFLNISSQQVGSYTIAAPTQQSFWISYTSPFPATVQADGNVHTFSQTIYGQNGFSGQVDLLFLGSSYTDLNGNPGNASNVSLVYASNWWVDQVSGTGSAIGQVLARPSAPAGYYYFQYALTGGTGASYYTYPFTVTLVVTSTSQPSDFQLSAPSVNASISAGGSPYVFTEAVTSTGNFNSPVTFSTSGWPSGVTASISPSTLPASSGSSIGGTVSISVQAASGSAATNTTAYITAAGGGKTHTIAVNLNFASSGNNPQAPSVTLLQPSQTIASYGAASFPVYVSQAAGTTSSLGMSVASGTPAPTNVQIRPSALTGPGWATVTIYGPPVASSTPYTFNVSATTQQSPQVRGTSSTATLTVSPTGLQPDFVLSTTAATVGLSQNVQSALSITIDAVDGYTGNVTFTSTTPGVSVTQAPLSVGTNNLGVTLTTSTLPAVLYLTGTDTTGLAHQLRANCTWGGGGGGGGTSQAFPNTATYYADVPIGGTTGPIQFAVSASLTVLNNLIATVPSLPPCQVNGLSIRATGGWYIGSQPIGLYFAISAASGLQQGSLPSVLCNGIWFNNLLLYNPGCSPSISGMLVNGENTNTVIAGTAGTITLTGTCLAGADAVVSDNQATVYMEPVTQVNSDGSVNVDYVTVACPDAAIPCATAGPHTLTLLAQNGQAQTPRPLNVDSMTSLSVSQPPTPDAVTGIAPVVNPLHCIDTNSAFAIVGATISAPPACNGFVVVFLGPGTITIDASASFQPSANAGQVRWQIDRDRTDSYGTSVPALPLLSPTSGLTVTLQPSTPGNFRLVAYIDQNGNGAFDEGEQLQVLQVAILRATWQPETSSFTISNTMIPKPTANNTTTIYTDIDDPPTNTGAPMQITVDYLVEGGGSLHTIGTTALSLNQSLGKASGLGDVGNLVGESFSVAYPGPPPGTETEYPGGTLPMVDTLANPTGGGASAFRGYPNDTGADVNFRGIPTLGVTLHLRSADAPEFIWDNVEPNTQQPWATTSGGISFREFVAAFSQSFPQTYVALNQASWQMDAAGINISGNWLATGFGITGDSAFQSVSATMQVLGKATVPNNGMRPNP